MGRKRKRKRNLGEWLGAGQGLGVAGAMASGATGQCQRVVLLNHGSRVSLAPASAM
jgi:hypothetical protein